jgi:phosphoribosylformylglycinamidine synthase
MAEACKALSFPVVSGNVSLYNETQGRAILPTPVIGAVGLIKDISRTVGIAAPAGASLLLIGATQGHLGQSLYLREIQGREEGAPPPVDLAVEKKNGDLVRSLIESGKAVACHDLSDGGLMMALVDMALAGNTGIALNAELAGKTAAHAFWFGEDQGRYLLASRDKSAVLQAARSAGVPIAELGNIAGTSLTVPGLVSISVGELRRANEAWLPGYMEAAE